MTPAKFHRMLNSLFDLAMLWQNQTSLVGSEKSKVQTEVINHCGNQLQALLDGYVKLRPKKDNPDEMEELEDD